MKLASGSQSRGERTTLNLAVLLAAGLLPVGFEAVPLIDSVELQGAARLALVSFGAGLVGFQIWRARADHNAISATDSDLNDLRIAVKESFLPIASQLAAMPSLTPNERKHAVKRVADKATSVLAYLLLRHIPRVRANVYVMTRNASRLVPLSSGGAGDQPGAFVAGGQASDANLAWVVSGGPPRHVRDVRKVAPGAGGRPDAPYNSYVAVVIRGADYTYGMVTVDSSDPDPFTDTDVQVIKVVAEMLAIGFAMAYPAENTS